MGIDRDAARRFLSTAYQPDDWIAVFLKSYETGRVGQRIAPVSVMMSPTVQNWIFRENEAGVNVFVSVNGIRPRSVSRARSAIGDVRHVFLDADHDGPRVVSAIAERPDLPPPSFLLHSSPNRMHVFWRVAGFTTDCVETLQKHLAREFDTDLAATPCCQTTRLPGCWNHKYRPASLVTVGYRDVSQTYAPMDFPLPPSIRPREPPVCVSCTTLLVPVLERARRYVRALPPAITEEHGDQHTFRVCCRLVRGFALSDSEALGLLMEWNVRCDPPWSERELMAKLRHARRYGREPIGGLLQPQQGGARLKGLDASHAQPCDVSRHETHDRFDNRR